MYSGLSTLAAFGRVTVKGALATPWVWRAGAHCSPLWLFAVPPPLQSSLQAPFSAATAKWGQFLFGVGVGGYFYHWGTTICSQFLLPVAVSLDWLK